MASAVHHQYIPFYRHILHWFIPHERNSHYPHALRRHALAWYGLSLVAIKAFVTLSLFLVYPNEAQFSTLTAQRIIELTNAVRTEAGIPALVEHPLLTESAQLKAKDMAENGYFSHKSPQGNTPWEWFKKSGYEYTYAGENLAMDFKAAEDVVIAWMESPKHRENIINSKYADIGIAVTTGTVNGRVVTLVVQHFGTSYASSARRAVFKPIARASTTVESSTQGNVTTVAAARTQVTFLNNEAKIVSLFASTKLVFTVFALVLGALLIINSFLLRGKLHHRSMIYMGLVIMALSVAFIFANTHFIEQIGERAVIVF